MTNNHPESGFTILELFIIIIAIVILILIYFIEKGI